MSADGVTGLIVPGAAVSGKLELGKAYVIYKPDSLSALGVTSSADDANAYLYRCVQQFYAEAGLGAELWVMAVPTSTLPSAMLSVEGSYAKKLLRVAGGRVRTLVAAAPATVGATIEDGLDEDVWDALANGQALGEWAATELYAPVVCLVDGRGYASTAATDLKDLGTLDRNRVGICVGEVEGGSLAAVVAGRAASIPVQRHVGRVADGALKVSNATVGGVEVGEADVTTLDTKGYITLRTFVGKSGYFVCDDHLATAVGDDYHSFARRRVVDKAYRIAYGELLEKLLDEVPVTAAGSMLPSMAKSWEGDVVAAIALQMTSNGELSSDGSKDQGVTCAIDTESNVLATGKVGVDLRVKPHGYAKYIEVSLGFAVASV